MTLLSVPALATSPVVLMRRGELWHPEREISRGSVVRVHRGVYAPADAWRALPPWERYRARVHAVALVHPDAVFSHESAAALRGLPVFGFPTHVHVVDDRDATARISGGVRTHPTIDLREIDDLGGIHVVGTRDVVVDHARFRHPAVALAVADAACREDPTITVEQLTAANEARASSRGRRLARWAITRADGRAERALESVSRAAIEWLGFAEPELQWSVRHPDGVVDRLDFRWTRPLVFGEADGLLKYDGTRGDPASVVVAEKRREDRLRRLADGFARWGWQDVMAPADLREILVRAGVPRVRAENAAPLAGLRSALSGAAVTH